VRTSRQIQYSVDDDFMPRGSESDKSVVHSRSAVLESRRPMSRTIKRKNRQNVNNGIASASALPRQREAAAFHSFAPFVSVFTLHRRAAALQIGATNVPSCSLNSKLLLSNRGR